MRRRPVTCAELYARVERYEFGERGWLDDARAVCPPRDDRPASIKALDRPPRQPWEDPAPGSPEYELWRQALLDTPGHVDPVAAEPVPGVGNSNAPEACREARNISRRHAWRVPEHAGGQRDGYSPGPQGQAPVDDAR